MILQMNLFEIPSLGCGDPVNMERKDTFQDEKGCLFQYLFDQALGKQFLPVEYFPVAAIEKNEEKGGEIRFGMADLMVKAQKTDFKLIEPGEALNKSTSVVMEKEPGKPTFEKGHAVRIKEEHAEILQQKVEESAEQNPAEISKEAVVEDNTVAAKTDCKAKIPGKSDEKIKSEATVKAGASPIDKTKIKDLPAVFQQHADIQRIETSRTEKTELHIQIGREVLSRIEHNRPMVFSMQLEPEDLGKIDVRLKINEGRLSIDIMAANSKTQALLVGQADKLINSMGLQNVQVENVQIDRSVDVQSDGKQNGVFGMNNELADSPGKQGESSSRNQGRVLSSVEIIPESADKVSEKVKNSFTKMDYLI